MPSIQCDGVAVSVRTLRTLRDLPGQQCWLSMASKPLCTEHVMSSPTDLTIRTRTIELKENTTIVVLGASGDLAKKKTVRSIPQPPLPEALG